MLPPAARAQEVLSNIERVVSGQSITLRHVLAAFLAGGHVLLEDNPGTGKTTLSKALAASVSASFRRVQFTPDLLPSDILGVSVFNPKDQSFVFHPGPVFTQILLADEINRASPRTQSALLEAMGEGQVSVEGRTTPLDELFFVIATQNPVEFRGTYPLAGIGPVITPAEVRALRAAVREVRVSDVVQRYIVDLVRATRSAPGVQRGAGPRASIALTRLAQALALVEGGEFVAPEHVRALAVPVVAHRLVLDPQAKFSGVTAQGVVADVLGATPVPA